MLGVAKGSEVKAGDLLVEADLDAIRAAGLDTTTVVIVTNSGDFGTIRPLADGDVAAAVPALLVAR